VAGLRPGGCGGYVGSFGFEARLLCQQTTLQVGQELFQFFQVGAIFECFFFKSCGGFGRSRSAPQTFRGAQEVGE